MKNSIISKHHSYFSRNLEICHYNVRTEDQKNEYCRVSSEVEIMTCNLRVQEKMTSYGRQAILEKDDTPSKFYTHTNSPTRRLYLTLNAIFLSIFFFHFKSFLALKITWLSLSLVYIISIYFFFLNVKVFFF